MAKKRGDKKIVLELKNVWKSYHMGDSLVHALKNVNLKIYKGDFIVILGRSGSGKSTLMNMMGVLDIPSKGHIYLNNKDITKFEESELAQIRGKKIGFVFQQFNLLHIFSAAENVALPMLFQDVEYKERIKKSEETLKLVNLGKRTTHKPSELSGGEQQRVAIARSLINNPEIILADEPTGNLDSKTGRDVMELISNLHKKDGKTIILVTHDVLANFLLISFCVSVALFNVILSILHYMVF